MKPFFVYFSCDQRYVPLAVSRLVHSLHECTFLVYSSVFIIENDNSE